MGAGRGCTPYSLLDIAVRPARVVERGSLPRDTTVADTTYRHLRVDGGPDRRFSHNPVIPICEYDELTLTTPAGEIGRFHLTARGRATALERAIKHAKELAAIGSHQVEDAPEDDEAETAGGGTPPVPDQSARRIPARRKWAVGLAVGAVLLLGFGLAGVTLTGSALYYLRARDSSSEPEPPAPTADPTTIMTAATAAGPTSSGANSEPASATGGIAANSAWVPCESDPKGPGSGCACRPDGTQVVIAPDGRGRWTRPDGTNSRFRIKPDSGWEIADYGASRVGRCTIVDDSLLMQVETGDGENSSTIFASVAASGELRWSSVHHPAGGPPLVHDGGVYVSAASTVGKIDLATGEYLWRIRVPYEHYDTYFEEARADAGQVRWQPKCPWQPGLHELVVEARSGTLLSGSP